ncbi:MAG: DUF2309 domain-containing protein [Methylotenera sp.]|nr:DUF2309 domain-containing protein [Methylotenera sp.]
MNLNTTQKVNLATHIRDDVLIACDRIAPTWPLDQSIAVNPWWKMRDLPMVDVAAKLQALGNVHMLMPKSYYHSLWQVQIETNHLTWAARELGVIASEAELVTYLSSPDIQPYWLNVCDLLDADPSHDHKMPWREEVVQQISQFTALYLQYPEQMQYIKDSENNFYQAWLDVTRQDKGIEVLMSESGLSVHFKNLPNNVDALFEKVHEDLFVENNAEYAFIDYCYALLLDVHGWASWLAYEAWQDAFDGKSNSSLIQLLAVRMAWDWGLWQHASTQSQDKFNLFKTTFKQQLQQVGKLEKAWHAKQQYQWVWQRALEYSYQKPLQEQLVCSKQSESSKHQLQAIFCIDVRSEPMRRALETQNSSIQTLGFAGFFGLPIEYSIAGSQYIRPQLPGLLNASIRAEQIGNVMKRKAAFSLINKQVAEKQSGDAAPSGFGFVEAKGLYRGVSLIKKTLFPSKPLHSINQIDLEGAWQLSRDGKLLSDSELADLSAGILHAIGLNKYFAPTILLVGHGSSSTNNPHASSLDCGACGGQTGEVNVKVLAQVLNTSGVRIELSKLGINIPAETQFIPSLHNTTTDEVVCFGVKNTQPWQNWLRGAKDYAQNARASSLGVITEDKAQRDQGFQNRANDWAQLRPEWGLANNAAFIVAPRFFTQNLDLRGRSFLHDYKHLEDEGFNVLELIMTAPMIVTNWINLQYYASVTDNLKYGSGNKLLHNVVGGKYGVFEGNGGDLRIGLSMQSLHDGQEWRHHPLRLSVYIAASREAITGIIAKHQAVADLIQNNWLFLYQWDTEQKQIWQFAGGEWQLIQTADTQTFH